MTTPKTEEYLEAIYKIEQTEKPVRASRVAEHLQVSPASVTEMLKRMVKRGLIERGQDAGISLTDDGKKAALGLVRRHRLSERFLTDLLGLSWDKVHDEACKLEHVFSDEVEESLERVLQNPRTCPHGHPIPAKDGTCIEEPTRPLSELEAGEEATIVKISEEEPKMLQYLATLGLLPCVHVRVCEVAPFRGPLLVEVGRAKYALGREVASKIQIKGTR